MEVYHSVVVMVLILECCSRSQSHYADDVIMNRVAPPLAGWTEGAAAGAAGSLTALACGGYG